MGERHALAFPLGQAGGGGGQVEGLRHGGPHHQMKCEDRDGAEPGEGRNAARRVEARHGDGQAGRRQ